MEVVRETFGVLAFSRTADEVHSRFFAPAGGVDEDPATGSAAVALAEVLATEGEPTGAVVIFQGAEMGHPSTIQMKWDHTTVAIGGTVIRDEARFLET